MITTPAQTDPLTLKLNICSSVIVAGDVTLCGLQRGQEVPGAASQEPNSVTAHCKANTTSTAFVMISFGQIHKYIYIYAKISVSAMCCLSVICRLLTNREQMLRGGMKHAICVRYITCPDAVSKTETSNLCPVYYMPRRCVKD